MSESTYFINQSETLGLNWVRKLEDKKSQSVGRNLYLPLSQTPAVVLQIPYKLDSWWKQGAAGVVQLLSNELGHKNSGSQQKCRAKDALWIPEQHTYHSMVKQLWPT